MNNSTAIRLVTKYWSLWRKPRRHLLGKQLSAGDTEGRDFLFFCLVIGGISVFLDEKSKELCLRQINDSIRLMSRGGIRSFLSKNVLSATAIPEENYISQLKGPFWIISDHFGRLGHWDNICRSYLSGLMYFILLWVITVITYCERDYYEK